jgi:hypothetical protein
MDLMTELCKIFLERKDEKHWDGGLYMCMYIGVPGVHGWSEWDGKESIETDRERAFERNWGK